MTTRAVKHHLKNISTFNSSWSCFSPASYDKYTLNWFWNLHLSGTHRQPGKRCMWSGERRPSVGPPSGQSTGGRLLRKFVHQTTRTCCSCGAMKILHMNVWYVHWGKTRLQQTERSSWSIQMQLDELNWVKRWCHAVMSTTDLPMSVALGPAYLTDVFLFFNCILNPIIYCLRTQDFRRALREIPQVIAQAADIPLQLDELNWVKRRSYHIHIRLAWSTTIDPGLK